MIRRTICSVVVALSLMAPWLATTPAQEGSASGYPRVFQVKPDKLNLRAGIGQNYKILVTVRQGDQLVGEEEQVGWIRVRPPKGIRCYVSRDFVDGTSGGSGTVNADHVNLRPTPSTTHPPLLQLNRGDSVRIVGEVEGWYEIEAPPAVGCWASKEQLIEVGSWTGREATVDITGGGILPDNRGGGRNPASGVGDSGSGSVASGTAEDAANSGSGITGVDSGGISHATSGTGSGNVVPPAEGVVVEHPTPGTQEPTTEIIPGTGKSDSGMTSTPGDSTSGTGTGEPGTNTSTPGVVETVTDGSNPTSDNSGATWQPTPADGVASETGIREHEASAMTTEQPVVSPGTASFEEGMRLARAEDEKDARSQDYRATMRQLEIAMAAGLAPEERLRAEVELRRMGSSQKILDELRAQDREIRAISEAERRRQRDETRKQQPLPYVAEGYVDSVGKVIRRPAAHKMLKGKRILYFLTSIKFNLDDYIGKRIGVRGKIIDSPGWEYRTVIVEELDVLGE